MRLPCTARQSVRAGLGQRERDADDAGALVGMRNLDGAAMALDDLP